MQRSYEKELMQMIEVHGFEAVVAAAEKFWGQPQTQTSSMEMKKVDAENGFQQ